MYDRLQKDPLLIEKALDIALKETKDDDFNYKEWFNDSGGVYMNWSATSSSDYDDFVYYFRVFNLLAQKEAFASDKYILARL